ncbi:unnamed protein product [Dibothriocephalus latus]|uniref:Uncharacterized protein n=1 Tax=Dibothriocephalus latus TaxID=60516 RepID=A0A3P7PDV9_DIBLA|nr:unnamed protein product [Dibothriocephalus latus]
MSPSVAPKTVIIANFHRSALFYDATFPRQLYTASIEFLDGIELRTDSLKQVQKLRQHSSYSAFLGKWSLPVYFQLSTIGPFAHTHPFHQGEYPLPTEADERKIVW